MNEDKIIEKLLEHDEQFKAVREEINSKFGQVLQGQDKILTILNRLDNERLVHSHAIMDLNDRVDNHDETINKIKTQLKTA